MVPLWSETCWSTFKYFILLIVSTCYILCIRWIIKCLIIIDVRCKHEDTLQCSCHGKTKESFLSPRFGFQAQFLFPSTEITYKTYISFLSTHAPFFPLFSSHHFHLPPCSPEPRHPDVIIHSPLSQFGLRFPLSLYVFRRDCARLESTQYLGRWQSYVIILVLADPQNYGTLYFGSFNLLLGHTEA